MCYLAYRHAQVTVSPQFNLKFSEIVAELPRGPIRVNFDVAEAKSQDLIHKLLFTKAIKYQLYLRKLFFFPRNAFFFASVKHRSPH